MNDRPLHTDRAALERNRKRARLEQVDFLHEAVIDEVQFRLGMVNRTFTSPAIVTGHPEIWCRSFPDAHIVSDEETLNLKPQAHDLIIHAMSLHWSNDIVGQLIQSKNALKPDGLFIGSMLGGTTLNELRSALSEAEIAISGGLSARVASMADIRDVGSLLQRAGLTMPVVDKLSLSASYETIFHLARDLRRMGEASALALRKKSFEKRALFALADTIYRQHFADGESKILASYEILFLTGWAPDESQPKPLRPGSAQARLADMLNTNEHKLKS